MSRQFFATARFTALFMGPNKREPSVHHFFVNAALTGTEYPIFFAPEVGHLEGAARNHFWRSLPAA
jgi:hypothetical protein